MTEEAKIALEAASRVHQRVSNPAATYSGDGVDTATNRVVLSTADTFLRWLKEH